MGPAQARFARGTPRLSLGAGINATVTAGLVSDAPLDVLGGGLLALVPSTGENNALSGGLRLSGAGTVVALQGNNTGGSMAVSGPLGIGDGAVARALSHNPLGQLTGTALSPLLLDGVNVIRVVANPDVDGDGLTELAEFRVRRSADERRLFRLRAEVALLVNGPSVRGTAGHRVIDRSSTASVTCGALEVLHPHIPARTPAAAIPWWWSSGFVRR